MVAMPAPVYEIQGPTTDLSTLTSPLEGELVTTEGVVTVVLGNGFFIQDPIGDGDAATSDGLFVFTGEYTDRVTGRLGARVRHCDRVSAQRPAE